MKRKLNKAMRGEEGQALIIALVLMLVGSIIVAPLLAYMGTGLKAGKEVYEERMYAQYAADAGVQDALFKIEAGDLPEDWEGTWEPDIYYDSYGPPDYPSFQLNGNDVKVTIKPYWLLTGLEDTFWGEMPHADLLVVGDSTSTAGSNGLYKITISFGHQKNLKIERIGAWLPPGYDYVPGSSNLEQLPSGDDAYCKPADPVPFRGGKAIIWDYEAYGGKAEFGDLDPLDGAEDEKATITFEFTPQANLTSAFSWVVPGSEDIHLSYDANVKTFQIESEAQGGVSEAHPVTVTVNAYASQNEPRMVGSGIAGDYVATGNTLMLPDPSNNPSYPNQDWRSRLLKESDATITSGTDIPTDATVEAAYLYWSGWIDRYYWHAEKTTGSHGTTYTTWSWVPYPDAEEGGIDELNYYNYSTEPSQLVENAQVNIVSFGAGSDRDDITADLWQVWPKMNDSTPEGIENCWYYTCLYDATDLINELIANSSSSGIGSNGAGTYTLGHASQPSTTVINKLRPGYNHLPGDTSAGDYYSFTLYEEDGSSTTDYTGYPLGTPAHMLPSGEWDYPGRYHASYAGWSLVIIYSSPQTKGHQLYLYDIASGGFIFKESYPEGASESNPDFDGDGLPGGKISGFLVPPQVSGEVNAAKMTCFVGEGDLGKTGDSFEVTGQQGGWNNYDDGVTTYKNDVWNSLSVGITAPGIDIDTFYIPWDDNILIPGDTEVQVDIPTVGDGFTLSYIILSFRSKTEIGGAISYVYVGG